MIIRNVVRRLVPVKIKKYVNISAIINSLKEKYYINTIQREQQNALADLQGKAKIRCCFFAIHVEVWKYDDLYKLMLDNPRFEPVVLICPVVNYGYENMIERMRENQLYFEKKGYKTILSYDPDTKKYVDVRKEINPDIIVYTNPYKGLIDDRYYIDKFRDTLTIYVPYSMNNSQAWEANYNLLFYNLLWRHYQITDRHKAYAVKYSRNKGINAVTVGYPGIEGFICPFNNSKVNVWKSDDRKYKRIIWAPHHTITPVGCVYFSCFLRYYEFMIDLAEKYKSQVLFAFKPHPLLKNKLDILWGKEKTKEYYDKWAIMENTSVNEGDYIDLFISSDAMIHDSGSFISEYLYVNKPVMRTLNEVEESEKMNDFAMECIANHYLANNEQDIEQFIQNVINGVDPLKDQRTKFVNEVLMPKGSPSQNIIDDILDSIDNQILYRN